GRLQPQARFVQLGKEITVHDGTQLFQTQHGLGIQDALQAQTQQRALGQRVYRDLVDQPRQLILRVQLVFLFSPKEMAYFDGVEHRRLPRTVDAHVQDFAPAPFQKQLNAAAGTRKESRS